MKLLTALFIIIALPMFGATPSYEKFIGAGGITVTPNPPFGNIIIDGSGVVSSGTNSSIRISTNAGTVTAAATNVSFHAGNNTVVKGTNVGMRAEITYGMESNLTFISGLGPMVLGTWGNVFGISNASLNQLSMWLDELDSSDAWNFQDTIIVGGIVVATNIHVTAIPGSGNIAGISTIGELFRTNYAGGISSINENTAAEQFITLGTNIIDSTRSPTMSNGVNGVNFNFPYAASTVNGILHSNDWVRFNASAVAPPWSSVQFNSNGVQQGSAKFVFTNSNVGIGTATPDAPIHYSGASATRIGGWSSDPGYGALSFIGALNSAGNYTLKGSPGVNTSLNAPGSSGSDLEFNIGNTNKMIITELGRVGIGTNAPSARLHVRPFTPGQSYVRMDNTDGTPLFQFGEYPSTPTDAIFYMGNVVAGANNFAMVSDGASLTLNAPDAGGSIGLGVNGINYWFLEADGHFKPTTDSTYDLGTFALNVRTGYVDYPFIIPNAGTGKVLTSDANGIGTWQVPASGGGGTPGGEHFSVQFNSNSVFQGDTMLQYHPLEWHSENFGPSLDVGRLGGSTNIMDPYGFTVLGNNDMNFRTPGPTIVRWKIKSVGGHLEPGSSNGMNIGSLLLPYGTNFSMAMQMHPNAGNGKVLTSDANGFGTWQAAAGGGGAGSLAVNDNQFVTNSVLNFKSGALVTNLNIKAAQGASLALTVNTNALVVTNGNVGIGTANPARQLSVNGILEIGSGHLFFATGSDLAVEGGSGSAIFFKPSGTERVRITSTGLGISTTAPTNALDVSGHASIRTNLFLPNLPTNASPVAFLAVDGGGKVFETAVPAAGGGGISGIIAGNSNQIPYLDHTGTNYTYGAGALSTLTNAGFGFRPTGPHGGYGGLMVYSDTPMGLLTVGHPNPASDFQTFSTAFVVSNRYDSAANYQNDMVKFEAVMIGGGLSPTSTLSRWRVWQGTTSSNDVMSIDVSGLLTTTGFKLTNGGARNRTFKSDDIGTGSWGPPSAGGNGNTFSPASFAPIGAIQFAQTNVAGLHMMLDGTNTMLYRREVNEFVVTNTVSSSNTTIGAGYIKTWVLEASNLNVSTLIVTNGLPAAGAEGDVQYNSGGVLGAEAAFNYDAGDDVLTAPNINVNKQITYNMPLITVVGANSNQTVWVGTTNTVDMLVSTNMTFTNFVPIAASQSATYLAFMKITNSAGNIGVDWGLGTGFGRRIFTNANNTIWTTLTNTKTYVASWTFRGTNGHLRLSLEE